MFNSIFLCSTALLRGLELQYGRHSARLKRPGQLAYDEAARFVDSVGPDAAVIAAHRVLNPKKGKVRWL